MNKPRLCKLDEMQISSPVRKKNLNFFLKTHYSID